MKKVYIALSLVALSSALYAQSSIIYGTAVKNSPSQTFLGRINGSTGAVTNISPSTLGPNYVSCMAAIDPYNSVYYYQSGTNQIIGVDVNSGMVITNPAMTNPNASLFDLVVFNCQDSALYGLARALGPTRLYLAKVNPITGAVTNISPSSVGSSFILTPATLDPVNQRFYFQDNSFQFVGLDLVSGNIMTAPLITYTNTNTNLFDSFVYNCADSTIYGLARKNSPAQMYLAKINPATGVVTNISTTSINSNGQTLGGATLDPVNKIFYFQDGNQNFIGLSLITGNVVSNAPVTNANANSYTNFRSNMQCNCPGITTGLKAKNITAGIKVYPNPFTNSLIVQLHSPVMDMKVKLLDMQGKIVLEKTFDTTDHCNLYVEKLSSGVYFLEINADGNLFREKVIKD